ncbi:MAG: hypothetical protein H7839_07970 [Magnetococcus sp. YQC-5]
MATCLITGGCGWMGSHLSDARITRGDTVRILEDLSTGKREQVDPRCEIIPKRAWPCISIFLRQIVNPAKRPLEEELRRTLANPP